MQRAGRAAQHDCGDGVCICLGRVDPRAIPAIKYLGKPAQALGGVDAALQVESHIDLLAGIAFIVLGSCVGSGHRWAANLLPIV